MKKLPFGISRQMAGRVLHTVHSDIMGLINPASVPGQMKFIITFVDDCSRLAEASLVKGKDQSGVALDKYLTYARNLLDTKVEVCYIKSDKGREYMGGEVKQIMEREKIKMLPSRPYTPELNGTDDKYNRIMQEETRSFMIDLGLQKSTWGLAVKAAVRKYNQIPHKLSIMKLH